MARPTSTGILFPALFLGILTAGCQDTPLSPRAEAPPAAAAAAPAFAFAPASGDHAPWTPIVLADDALPGLSYGMHLDDTGGTMAGTAMGGTPFLQGFVWRDGTYHVVTALTESSGFVANRPVGIRADGAVAFSTYDPSLNDGPGFLWRDGAVEWLPAAPDGRGLVPTHMSRSGWIAVEIGTGDLDDREPGVIDPDGTFIALPMPAGSGPGLPTQVSDDGVVVGTWFDAERDYGAVRWLRVEGAWTMEVIDMNSSNGRAISPNGVFAYGVGFGGAAFRIHPDGSTTPLPNPPGQSGWIPAQASDQGWVVGFSWDGESSVLWTGAEFVSVPDPESGAGLVLGLNAAHDLVGGSFTAGGGIAPTLWRVLPPEYEGESCVEQVESLRERGVLNGGQAQALLSRLHLAAGQLEDGRTRTAVNQLLSAMETVRGFTQGRILDETDGARLLACIEEMVAAAAR